jgi:hypothetical protein
MRTFLLVLAVVVNGLLTTSAFAQVTHAWLVPPPHFVKETYFSNLRDGASIETPYLVKFGLTGMGIAPVVKKIEKAGHHHLLINRDLPFELTKPIPFTDQYIHFGKGAMETVLTLEPGTYSLRLLFADYLHVPNFVHSRPVKVTVTAKNKDVDPKGLVKKGVAFLSPAEGASVSTPFRIQFHASGLNVSHVAIAEEGLGHFRLRLKPEGGAEQVITFSNGYTEAWLIPPAGKYQGMLEFLDNKNRDKVIASSGPLAFRVIP